MMCTVLRHRHPALTRAELTCDGGRRTVGSQVATYSLKLTLKAALCHSAFSITYWDLGPSVSRRPPRCFGRSDRLRQRAPTCTAARPRRRGPMRPWLIALCARGSVVAVAQSCGPTEPSRTCAPEESLFIGARLTGAWDLATGRCLRSQSLQLTVAG